MSIQFVNKSQLAVIVGLSPHTFRRYRERGMWIEGVHYVKVSQNNVLYNQSMVLDWIANRGNPAQRHVLYSCRHTLLSHGLSLGR